MRKNIKTCIYIVTAILPIVLSACSNKANDNKMPKSVKESTTTSTTFVEDTSSDITNTTVETTTEENTTELISWTEQDTFNSEDITSWQEPQTDIQPDIQQTTTVTSVNSTPAPVQNNEYPDVQTTPMHTSSIEVINGTENTSTFIPTTETTTPIPTTELIKQPSPILTVKGIGEKYIYKDYRNKEFCFTIESMDYLFDYIGYPEYYRIVGFIIIYFTEPVSLYCKYNIYNSDGICIRTDFIEATNEIVSTNSSDPNSHLFRLCGRIDISTLPIDDYTIEFVNYQ